MRGVSVACSCETSCCCCCCCCCASCVLSLILIVRPSARASAWYVLHLPLRRWVVGTLPNLLPTYLSRTNVFPPAVSRTEESLCLKRSGPRHIYMDLPLAWL